MRFKLLDVRQSFMCYWTPEPFPTGNDPTPYFSGTYLLTPDSKLQYYSDDNKLLPKKLPALAELEKIGTVLTTDKWAKKGPAILKAIKMTGKIFYRDGDTKPDYEGFPGTFFVSSRSKIRPNYFDQQKQEITEAQGLLYSGCYVNVTLEAYAYTKGNNGLGARLRGVQLLRKGEAFGGGGPPAGDDEFDEIDNPDEEAEETDELMG
jgi:Enterobacter phage Enc34, ssDNA-binding protein